MSEITISDEMRQDISRRRSKEGLRQVLSRIQMRLQKAYKTKTQQQAEMLELQRDLVKNRETLAELQSLVTMQTESYHDMEVDYKTTLKEIGNLEDEGVFIPPLEQLNDQSS